MGELVKFYPADAAKDPDNVLEQASGQYRDVLVIGWDEFGALDARASLGLASGPEILWLIESFKAKLLNGDFCGDIDE